jgi:hypothetical protein
MTWQLFTGSDDDWDRTVTNLHNQSPYQTSAWATFRKFDGWTPIRLVSTNHKLAVQLLHRQRWGLGVAWAPGGPVGDSSSREVNDLHEYLRQQMSGIITYVRLTDFSAANENSHEHYRHSGWRRPQKTLSSGLTLKRNLNSDPNLIRSTYTKNWARNLRRGEDRGIAALVWNAPDPTEIANLHLSVAESKGISTQDWRTSPLRIADVLRIFQRQLVVVRAVDQFGTTQAIRGAVLCGTTGFDFLAATSIEGRKTYASNVALHFLLAELAGRGAVTYDFGGVDPIENKGVYDFKHGAGGLEQAYVGEFENSYPRFVRPILSTLIAFRVAT